MHIYIFFQDHQAPLQIDLPSGSIDSKPIKKSKTITDAKQPEHKEWPAHSKDPIPGICDWPDCQYESPSLSKLKQHRESHFVAERDYNGLIKFKCTIQKCGRLFDTKRGLGLHAATHK